jgi:ABC-type nickel/cobalt efflux system permease component RcnA
VRRGLIALGLAVAAPLLVLWAAGGLDAVTRWSVEAARAAQEAMAAAIRAVRAGHPGAVAGLLAVAFGYGVAHAAGPGHGKVLIGGYAMARRVRLAPLAALSLAASLAQATTAVAVVYAGVLLFGWTRERMAGIAEDWLAPASQAAVAGVGLWLAWRGWRHRAAARGGADRAAHLQPPRGPDHGHHHDHHHHDHAACGHAHGVSIEAAAAVTSPREAAALVAGVALRPCTGAIFLLVLTWGLGIGWAGVAGAYAMGLGTALVTLAVAALVLWAREGALQTLAGGRIARVLPLVEIAAGLAIAAAAGLLLAGAA